MRFYTGSVGSRQSMPKATKINFGSFKIKPRVLQI